jgi:hypothetical protein
MTAITYFLSKLLLIFYNMFPLSSCLLKLKIMYQKQKKYPYF